MNEDHAKRYEEAVSFFEKTLSFMRNEAAMKNYDDGLILTAVGLIVSNVALRIFESDKDLERYFKSLKDLATKEK